MALPPNIRVNARVNFPSVVQGDAFIAITKSNGVYTIKPNYALLAPGVYDQKSEVAIFNPSTGVYAVIPLSDITSGGGISYRTITAAGDVNWLTTDSIILMDKTAGAATNIFLLPSVQFRTPIIIKDLKGDANVNPITIVPATGETIDGYSAAAAAANGLALIDVALGAKKLYPLTFGGWFLV